MPSFFLMFSLISYLPVSFVAYLPAEISRDVLSRLGEREKRRGRVVAHDLLQLVDVFRDLAKSGLAQQKQRVLCDDATAGGQVT